MVAKIALLYILKQQWYKVKCKNENSKFHTFHKLKLL